VLTRVSFERDPASLTQTGWPWLRGKLFHLFFLFTRPMTLGVRAIVCEQDPTGRRTGRVFLIRHTYVPGWQLPGGGVEWGETAEEALLRELAEEGNIAPVGTPALKSVHLNRAASRRDHVLFYVVDRFEQPSPKLPDREIAEAGFFPVGALPEGVTAATRRRIAETFGDAAPSKFW
jgi:ADP-ribose pyrophosphatase YjhB (NUDIX family)